MAQLGKGVFCASWRVRRGLPAPPVARAAESIAERYVYRLSVHYAACVVVEIVNCQRSARDQGLRGVGDVGLMEKKGTKDSFSLGRKLLWAARSYLAPGSPSATAVGAPGVCLLDAVI